MPQMLASPGIPPGNEIPEQFTCNGSGISPPLSWSGVPEGTGSLVLVVEDPDAPSGIFRHWVVFDIPPTARCLDAGYSANRSAAGLHEARNDFGKTGYGGPCPPPGRDTHRYHFRLLAISRPTLDVQAAAPALAIFKAQPYVIQQAEFVATYRQ